MAARAVRQVGEEMLRLVHPAEARISPDGHLIAVTAAGPEGTGILVTPADGPSPQARNEAPRASRASTPDDGTARHTPRWLPDSRTLLHIALPADGRHPHLAVLDTADGESRLLVRAPGDVEDLLVSDDGTEALLLTAEDGAERDGMNLGLPVRLGAAPDPERFAPGLGRRRLHRVDLATGRLREAGPDGLTVWNVAWRGGDTAVATVSTETLPSGYYTAHFAALDLDSRTARTLYRPQGQLAAPALSADGSRAAVSEGISIVAGRPLVVDLTTGEITRPDGLEDVTWLEFGIDGTTLWHAGWHGTGVRAGHTGTTTPQAGWTAQAGLTGPGFRPALSLSADHRIAATVLDAPGRPAEAVVAPTQGPDAWRWQPVTTLNSGGIPALSGIRTTATDWPAPDGTTVQGLLLDAPGGTDPDRPRPLAVLLHGGPSWQWTASHAPGDVLGLAPALAAAGYLVLLPNPRGSSGRGLDYARAVVGDVGGADLDDVLSGVRRLIADGLADPDRTAVLGHSYGGYLAALAAARTDLFRAAVVVSAPADWESFRDSSNIGGGYDETYRIAAPPADPSGVPGIGGLRPRSAVVAHGGSGTPTLVIHGAEDRVTPVGQAHQLYRALRRAGRAAVELYVYPGEGHEFTDPGHLLDAAARAEAWLDLHLAGTTAPAPVPSAAPPRPSAAAAAAAEGASR
ncbi:alpha/beta fold hydrolase [Streptomyces sp. NPDC048106]|uniref:S9 family peptidase n=1 Tax=Streptomyces sp. NPDC048106 TaxID=3155750 RepID=UPI003455BFE7